MHKANMCCVYSVMVQSRLERSVLFGEWFTVFFNNPSPFLSFFEKLPLSSETLLGDDGES